jgi:hypothetical protein
LRTEIGLPGTVTYTDVISERLAVRIGTCQAAEIAPVANRLAGNEK